MWGEACFWCPLLRSRVVMTPRRTLIVAAAGIGLVSSLSGAALKQPLAIVEPTTAETPIPPAPAVSEPDFAPIGDATVEPREVKPRPGLNVYKATQSGVLSPAVAGIPERVYVPNSASGTGDVIDPATHEIIPHY